MLNAKRWTKLTGNINNPAASQVGTTSIRLPTGVRLHELVAKVTLGGINTVRASITDVRLRIGNVQRDVTLARYDDILSLDGVTHGVRSTIPEGGGIAYIPFPFTELFLDSGAAREEFALDIVPGLVGYAELVYASLAAPPTIEWMACWEPLAFVPTTERNLLGNVPRLTKWLTTTPAAAGTSNDFDALIPALEQDDLRGLHLFDPTGAKISRVYLRIDGEEVFDRTKDDVDYDLAKAEMQPVIGRFDIIPELYKNSDAWDFNTARQMKIRVEYDNTASGTVPIVARTWGPLD